MEAEDQDAGLFASLLASGVAGGAADVLGRITAASPHACVDQSLSPFQQRPIVKVHLSTFAAPRLCKPAIEFKRLRLLTQYFSRADAEL